MSPFPVTGQEMSRCDGHDPQCPKLDPAVLNTSDTRTQRSLRCRIDSFPMNLGGHVDIIKSKSWCRIVSTYIQSLG